MRMIQTRPRLSRRDVLKAGGAGLLAMQILPGGLVIRQSLGRRARRSLRRRPMRRWCRSRATSTRTTKLEDKFYAAAVDALDQAAHPTPPPRRCWRTASPSSIRPRVAPLRSPSRRRRTASRCSRQREASPFVQKLRGNLVTGLYNNKEVWPIFGYEGESASKGGYIDRGFDDIDWL